jgi:P4 family phage/plasmid primase-like protien
MNHNSTISEIKQALNLLFQPGDVIELRCLKTRKGTISGYFNDFEQLARVAASLSGNVEAVYVTLNPVNPDLLARSCNQVKPYARETTSDSDITARRWLPLDFDPVRPAGISSTDAEHELALERARQVRDWLRSQGWPEPIFADSGNGAHLLYRVNFSKYSNALQGNEFFRQILEAVAFHHAGQGVEVDQKVFNPARIWKLYGTMACKGDNLPDRPHRLARLLEVPEKIEPVPLPLLEKVAAMLPRNEVLTNEAEGRKSTYDAFDLEAWIREHGLPVVSSAPWNGGRKWILNPCPWNPEHTNKAAYIVQFANGAIAAGCHHNGCRDKDWHALRDLYEPGWRDKQKAKKAKSDKAKIEIDDDNDGLEHLTDLGNARRLVKQHGENLRYCHLWGKWLVWDGKRWKKDETGAVLRLAKNTVRSIYAEAAEEPEEAIRRKIADHARKSESALRIKAMITLAESEPGIPVLPGELDRDPWLMNVKNGTIDLRTGELRPHRREDLMTKIAPIEYDPAAKCPTWKAFLDRIMAGNERLIAFLQRAAGYSLTASTREQCFFLLYGTGANGKSVFLTTLLAAMGDYGIQAAPDLLLAKSGESHPTEIADLFGARLVVATETEAGRRLAENLVKQLTGGDRLKARFMRQDFFEFEATHKIWLATNNKPIVKGTDYAIWRRIKLIPFTVTIPKEEQDKALPAKLRQELPGILSWAVKGCLEWQKRGLDEPAEVTAATSAYRDEQDVLGSFITDCCVVNPNAKVSAKDLYRAYVNWCEDCGEHALAQRNFGTRLSERGFLRKTGTGGYSWWHGIGLKAKVLAELPA